MAGNGAADAPRANAGDAQQDQPMVDAFEIVVSDVAKAVDATVKQYKELVRSRPHHVKARKIAISPTWIKLKKAMLGWDDDLTYRVETTGIIEEAIPNYRATDDPEGFLLQVKIKPGEENELNQAIRDHLRYLETLSLGDLKLPQDLPFVGQVRDSFGDQYDTFRVDRSDNLASLHNTRARLLWTHDWIERHKVGFFENVALPACAGNFDIMFAKNSVHLKGQIRTTQLEDAAMNMAESFDINAQNRYDRRRSYLFSNRVKTASLDNELVTYEVLILDAAAIVCSDIESDAVLNRERGRETWAVRTPEWRNPKLTMLYHFLDAIYYARQDKKLIYRKRGLPEDVVAKTPTEYGTPSTREAPPRKYKTVYCPKYLQQARDDGELLYLKVAPAYQIALPELNYYEKRVGEPSAKLILNRWDKHKLECTVCGQLAATVEGQQDQPV